MNGVGEKVQSVLLICGQHWCRSPSSLASFFNKPIHTTHCTCSIVGKKASILFWLGLFWGGLASAPLLGGWRGWQKAKRLGGDPGCSPVHHFTLFSRPSSIARISRVCCAVLVMGQLERGE